jgi:hypothetical protein
MANIIDAIINLVNNPQIKLLEYSKSHNRANNMGAGLEEYVKDLFAGTVGENDQNSRNQKFSHVFSYTGNQNNPPDAMLSGGDAIEVKKIESNNSALALNSSYPKAKLFANSTLISKDCRECEDWDVKDMIYAIGVVNGSNLKSLALVGGTEYCADKETYEKARTTIKNGIEAIPNIEFAKTNELARVNRVDPLGITNLRIRGMWTIENPFTVFDYIYKKNETKQFNFFALIAKDKYFSFDNHQSLEDLAIRCKSLEIDDAKVKNPNNPSQLKDVKVIKFSI